MPARRLPPAAWIAPAALVVLGVLGYMLFGGGSPASIIHSGSSETIPPFDFTVGKVTPVPIAKDAKHTNQVLATAKTGVASTLTDLYTEAFLDPANWRDGSYDEVWPLFAGASEAAAQRDASALTVGGGGAAFDTIDQPKGHIDLKVLLDAKGQPTTVVAVVRFQAIADRTDGKVTLIRSTGQYFLRHESNGWRVYAFDVHRDDKLGKAPASPSAGASAGASS